MRTFGLACLLSLVLLSSGCGNVFVRANWNGGNQTVSGVVSLVQLTVVIDNHNVSTQVTVVTLLDNLGASNFSFCGDQRSQFPVDRFAQATFAPGQPCSTLLAVVIKI
ncbi:MAG: hypothetical protein WAQ52_01700 [Terriglobales bacterium]